MAGTCWHGNHVGGEIRRIGVQFSGGQNLPTGDSGMICFAEAKLDSEVRKWTWLGIDKDTFCTIARACR
jgi:hypothetical protein